MPQRRRKPTRAEKLAEQHRWKLSLLRSFIARHGWSALNKDSVVPPGVNLFNFVRTRRQQYHHGRRGKEMPHWLIVECESVPGWSWDPVRDLLKRGFDTVRTFVHEHGWQAMTVETVVDGVSLSQWCANRRMEKRQGRLDPWLARALESIPGWSWDPRTKIYVTNLRSLRDHVERRGWASITQPTISRDGIAIGKWANHIRVLHRQGGTPAWLDAALESIDGWTWEPGRDRQSDRVALVRRLYAERGPRSITKETIVEGIAIGVWFHNARTRYRDATLSTETRRALEAIPGWSWE
jgi:hypothetical protein